MNRFNLFTDIFISAIFIVPIIIFFLYKIKRYIFDYFCKEAVCIDYENSCKTNINNYIGLYEFSINNMIYSVKSKEPTVIKPEIGEITKIFINKNEKNDIIPYNVFLEDCFCLICLIMMLILCVFHHL